MKTFRLVGAALLAVLMCVSFTSCSSDDEDVITNEDGTISNGKKLVEVKYSHGDYSEVTTFSYDNNGHLISEYYDGYISQYSWEGNTIFDSGENLTYSLVDGLIRTGKSSTWSYDFAYNSDKQIIANNCYYQKYIEYKKSFTWEDGKITKIVEDDLSSTEVKNITYSTQTCKGYNPLIGSLVFDYYISYAHPELFGIRLNHLPTKIVQKSSPKMQGTVTYDEVSEITYKFDNNGYITSCSIKETGIENWGYEEREYTDSYTISFTWQ